MANTFVTLSEKVVPSVVNISTLSRPDRGSWRGRGDAPTPEDFFRRFFEGPGGPREGGDAVTPRQTSLGTGFVIDEKGVILTNYHVIRGADEIRVSFTEEQDEKPTQAKVLGFDPGLDLALLEVKTSRKLIPLQFGDSDQLKVGEYVMAVGNPFGQGHSVTHGIISAKDRISPQFPLASYLQTDAPINPGNSGGPLLNLQGQVIGINNAIDARAQGIGFAIPSKVAVAAIPKLLKGEKISRGYLGVRVQPLEPELASRLGLPKNASGAVVAGADPGEPAFRAGLRPYDVITGIDGKAVKNPNDLISEVANTPAGRSVSLEVLRGSEKLKLKVALGERPVQDS